MQPILDIGIQDQADGSQTTIDNQYLASQLAQQGEQVLGVSADGAQITLADARGQFTVPVEQVLQKMGYQVTSMRPTAPDESRVNFGHRFALQEIGEEDMKKAYLETKLRKEGFENPQIMGKGRDWYAFDPKSSSWIALTNKSSWDTSDIAEGVAQVAKGVGATVGGSFGALAGAGGGPPGILAGAGLGAGAGNAMVQGGMRAGLEALDPEYHKVMTGMQHLKDIGVDSAVSGALAVPFVGAAKYGGPLLRGMATTGPVSSAVRATSGAGRAVASGTEKAAGFIARGPMRTDIAGSFVPGVMEGQIGSLAMQAPRAAMVQGPEYLARGVESGTGKALLGEEATSKIAGWLRSLLTKSSKPDRVRVLNESIRKGVLPGDLPPNARDVGRNLAEKLSGMFSREPANVGKSAAETYKGQQAKLMKDLVDEPLYGYVDNFMSSPSEEAAAELISRTAASRAAGQNAARAASWGKTGETFGALAENIGHAGVALEKGIRGTTRGVLRGVQSGAGVAKPALGALNRASTLTQPFENYLLANKFLQPYAEEEMARYFPSKKRQLYGTLLADQF
jgi:hypothetical protein